MEDNILNNECISTNVTSKEIMDDTEKHDKIRSDRNDWLYDAKTLISPHTNRPISNKVDHDAIIVANGDENIVGADGNEDIFWCSVCEYKMDSARRAILHMGGKFHRRRKTEREEEHQMEESIKRAEMADKAETETSLKRTANMQYQSIEPIYKKSKTDIKRDFDQRLTCEDCKMKFETTLLAIQHLKGKRHALTVTKKLESKKEQENKRNKSVSPVIMDSANTKVTSSFAQRTGGHNFKDKRNMFNQKVGSSSPFINQDVTNMNKAGQLRLPYSITIPGGYSVRNPMNLQRQQPRGINPPPSCNNVPPTACSLPQNWFGVLRQPFHPTPTPPINMMNTSFAGCGYHWPPAK